MSDNNEISDHDFNHFTKYFGLANKTFLWFILSIGFCLSNFPHLRDKYIESGEKLSNIDILLIAPIIVWEIVLFFKLLKMKKEPIYPRKIALSLYKTRDWTVGMGALLSLLVYIAYIFDKSAINNSYFHITTLFILSYGMWNEIIGYLLSSADTSTRPEMLDILRKTSLQFKDAPLAHIASYIILGSIIYSGFYFIKEVVHNYFGSKNTYNWLFHIVFFLAYWFIFLGEFCRCAKDSTLRFVYMTTYWKKG